MARDRETNEQIVLRLMRFSRYGALSQAFIVEAIHRYADACAKADPKDLGSAMLNGAAWAGVAREIKAEMDAKYGKRE